MSAARFGRDRNWVPKSYKARLMGKLTSQQPCLNCFMLTPLVLYSSPLHHPSYRCRTTSPSPSPCPSLTCRHFPSCIFLPPHYHCHLLYWLSSLPVLHHHCHHQPCRLPPSPISKNEPYNRTEVLQGRNQKVWARLKMKAKVRLRV